MNQWIAKSKKHIEHASGYLDLEMYEDALKEAEAALRVDSDNADAVAIKSSILWQSNRLTEAEPCMAKLTKLKPSDSSLWINLAYIRRRTQSLDAAVETLQNAFAVNPKDALAHYNMACYRI